MHRSLTFILLALAGFSLQLRAEPPGKIDVKESFDKAKKGGLPEGWARWSSTGAAAAFEVTSAKSLSEPNALTSTGSSGLAARAWLKESQPADVQVSVS